MMLCRKEGATLNDATTTAATNVEGLTMFAPFPRVAEILGLSWVVLGRGDVASAKTEVGNALGWVAGACGSTLKFQQLFPLRSCLITC